MLCYRDMTFCKAPCLTWSCERHEGNVPEEVRFGDFDMPVAWADFRESCGIHRPLPVRDLTPEDSEIIHDRLMRLLNMRGEGGPREKRIMTLAVQNAVGDYLERRP